MAEGTAWEGSCLAPGYCHPPFPRIPEQPTLPVLPPAGYKVDCPLLLFPGLPSVVLGRHTLSTRSFAMKFASSVIAAVFLAASSLVGAVPIGSQEIERKSAEGLSLLRFGLDVDPVWKTEEEKWELKKSGIDFMDVTETWVDMQSNPALSKASKGATTLATCELSYRSLNGQWFSHHTISSPSPVPPGCRECPVRHSFHVQYAVIPDHFDRVQQPLLQINHRPTVCSVDLRYAQRYSLREAGGHGHQICTLLGSVLRDH